jgi:hypothetical protein
MSSVGNKFTHDVFLARFDANGSYAWAYTYGLGGVNTVGGVAVDTAGGVVVAGGFTGLFQVLGQSAGGADIFIMKYDQAGTYSWGKRFGDSNDQSAAGVAVDGSGNIVITGPYTGSFDFGGSPLTAATGTRLFLAKFGPTGAFLWSADYGGPPGQTSLPYGVAVDASGNVIIAGTFTQSVDLGTGVLMGNGATAAFLAKFDPNGAPVWSRSFASGNMAQTAVAPAVDGAGNVYASGTFYGSINLGGGDVASAGGADVFVVKISSSGQYEWGHTYGNAANQTGYAIASDSSGDIVLTGGFSGSIDFGGGALQSAGQDDVFVAKLDTLGDHVWSKSFGDPMQQDGRVITVDVMANVIAAGTFLGTLDFGNGPLAFSAPTDAGVGTVFDAMFLAKLAP